MVLRVQSFNLTLSPGMCQFIASNGNKTKNHVTTLESDHVNNLLIGNIWKYFIINLKIGQPLYSALLYLKRIQIITWGLPRQDRFYRIAKDLYQNRSSASVS